MRGVFFVPTSCSTLENPSYTSYVWQTPFLNDIRDQLVTYENLDGTITNSDLELTATLAQHDIIAHTVSTHKAILANLHDNLPAVFWNWKGSTTTKGPADYLLRLQSLHARQYRYIPCHDYIPGPFNCMADKASQRTSLTLTQLLNLFNAQSPQQEPWKLCYL
jgi:hypothetical protein